ncbi:MAG: RtcB family protein [Nanoarchaeota archaeon]
MNEEQSEQRIGPPAELKKINDTTWELPASYKKGMRVPARIIATEELIKAMDNGVFNQISNVATLPGIQKYAFCMPDGHWGYGFPIGGVAAFDPEEQGIISPGGIGFDINCLVKGSKILTDFGYLKPVEDFETEFVDVDIPYSFYSLKLQKCMQSLLSFDTNKKSFSSKSIGYFMKKKQAGSILQIKSNLGYVIEVTEDHPILTKEGMVEAGRLSKSQEIAIYPYEGVSYECLDEVMLVDDQTLFTKQEKEELVKRNLFPLSIKNEKLPILTKLFGYLLGDGQIYFSGKKGFVCAYGAEEDLKEIQKDINKLGFSANIYGREREHSIPTKYGLVRFSNKNFELHTSSKSLVKLFFALGYPNGVKTNVPFVVPEWIMNSPLWIKRLFLSGLFGAELSKPRTHTKTGFDCPTFSQNKNTLLLENARYYCIQIMKLLEEFGVNTHKLLVRDDYSNRYRKTSRLKLQISSEEENLLKLWSKIGFSYNQKRELLSHIGIIYIKEKKILTQKRKEVAQKIEEYRKKGLKLTEIQKLLLSPITNERFITRHFYEQADYRIHLDFLSFNSFVKLKKEQYDEYGCFFDAVEAVTKKEYDDYVYDFNIPETHNFIAGNVIVSNCGMRLITTNLTVNEVKPKIKELVDALYQQVPAGVGCKGFVKLSRQEFREVMKEGAQWCFNYGYATQSDIEHIESRGKIPGADPSKVSDKAVKRGFDQLGTLGSGNHYLEIQEVKKENIFNREWAKVMGITKSGQIVIMVHCGSRGFGHQIGTDYLRTFLDVMPKYGIEILDKELACAPFNSAEGQAYYAAMACAANMAFANRQVIHQRIKEVFSKVFAKTAEEMEINLVYDVAHNIAKLEKHIINGREKELLVHRKGATRAFGPKRAAELPKKYAQIGQPVILGGSMETGSYLLLGTDGADDTFASTAHGAGRTMSRAAAKRTVRGEQLQKEMEKQGIYVHSVTMSGLAEEAGKAYKDIEAVVDSLEIAGITKRVVALKPIGNVKG